MMPRYFFHLQTDDQSLPDEIGTELDDDDHARAEAVETITGWAADRFPQQAASRQTLTMRIETEDHAHVATMSLRFEEEPVAWSRV